MPGALPAKRPGAHPERPDADRDPRRCGRVQPSQDLQELVRRQRHAARRRHADVDVQEDRAAEPGRAGRVVPDNGPIVISGDVHRLGIGARAGVPVIHPLVVERAGRVVVPEIGRTHSAVRESHPGSGSTPKKNPKPNVPEGVDVSRVMKCCVGVPETDGSNIPTCSYNVLYREKDRRFADPKMLERMEKTRPALSLPVAQA